MTCLRGLAELEQLEGPWLEERWPVAIPKALAITLRLLMAHMVSMSKRLNGAMVLDRLDVELAVTRLDAVVCHAVVHDSPFCLPGCQQSDEGTPGIARPNR